MGPGIPGGAAAGRGGEEGLLPLGLGVQTVGRVGGMNNQFETLRLEGTQSC